MMKIAFIFCFIFSRLSLQAAEQSTNSCEAPSPAGQRICLNMIVKDESEVIRRCLDSVKAVIDYWVIVDTGSTDATQEIIKAHLKGIPGELYERPWRNFGENRTEAFELAKGKGDYVLFMDADDTLEFEADAKFPPLSQDLCMMWRGVKGFTYLKPQLAKADLPWKWVGVTHEYLGCDQPHTSEILQGVKYISGEGGASYRDPKKKFMKNVELLTEGLKQEPDNGRYMFYLAESYRDAGEKSKALEWFQKRIQAGGWDEETFWAKLQSAVLLGELGFPYTVVAEAFLDAHRFRPHRVEPIYFLANLYNGEGKYEKAYEYLKAWGFIPQPAEKDTLFNMDWMRDYGLLFQLSICSYYVGHYEESLESCDQLLSMVDLPIHWRQIAESNRFFPLEKLTANVAEEVVEVGL